MISSKKTIQILYIQSIMSLYKLDIIYFLDVKDVANIQGLKNVGAAFLLGVRRTFLQ